GTGLGLSVVHGIVKKAGGAVTVASRRGEGTAFQVFLPRVEDTQAIAAPEEMPLPRGSERVLVADDELFILEIMTNMLNSLGYEVETADGGKTAIELFGQAPERFDIVIADLTMPKLTGTQLALKIKQLREDVPIILTTGMAFDRDSQDDQFKAFDAILTKPILYQDLAKKLREILDKKEVKG
ncbi:MAG: response regulator, partial [Desulfobacteraceae bacterium]